MLKKGKTIFLIFMLLTTLIIIINTENETTIVSAIPSYETYGGAEINYTWIKEKVQKLGEDIIEDYDRGREYGTPGEWNANEYLDDWWTDVGLNNVTKDTINKFWTSNHPFIDRYMGRLNKKR